VIRYDGATKGNGKYDSALALSCGFATDA